MCDSTSAGVTRPPPASNVCAAISPGSGWTKRAPRIASARGALARGSRALRTKRSSTTVERVVHHGGDDEANNEAQVSELRQCIDDWSVLQGLVPERHRDQDTGRHCRRPGDGVVAAVEQLALVVATAAQPEIGQDD